MIRTRSTEDQGLALAVIQIDGGTQSRATLNEQVVNEYAEAIQAGATFPPIVVYYDGKKHWLADGFHRFHAYQKAGREKVAADVRQGTRRDAILHSVGANEAHGLRRTNDDKRRAVLTLLGDTEWSKWSDGEIAKRCAVSREYVNRLRPIVTCDQVTSERTYVTKHGTTATMKTAGINASRTQFQAKASEDNGSITGGAGAVTGEASRLASGRTDAGEAASVDLPTIPEAARLADEIVAERNIFDELVALWKEADAGVRQDFRAYITGSEFVAKFNSKSFDGERSIAAAGSEHHSADHVSPPASQAAMGSGRASTGGEDVTNAGMLKTTDEAPHVEQTSLAAREGEKPLHSNSPYGATRRLDDLGSVQDGLKMSTDGQPKTGLSTDCIERPIEAGVTGGESAASSEGSRQSALVSDMADRGNASGNESVTAGETASNSNSSEPASSQALTDSPVLTSSPASGTPFRTLSPADRIKALRPNCLRPELCAGSGRQHCYSCLKAAGDEGEAA